MQARQVPRRVCVERVVLCRERVRLLVIRPSGVGSRASTTVPLAHRLLDVAHRLLGVALSEQLRTHWFRVLLVVVLLDTCHLNKR